MSRLPRMIRVMMDLDRERTRIVAEVMQVRWLMPLLMKPRNGQKWTRDDRVQVRSHVRRLAAGSPYLVALILPAIPSRFRSWLGGWTSGERANGPGRFHAGSARELRAASRP